MFRRTRIAPTPSGYLHLGNAYSFALTANLAHRYGSKLLLRIDDMDRQRVDVNYINDIFESLEFLMIEYDEGPSDALEFETSFTQRCRLPLYLDALQKLAHSGLVYACRCSRSAARHAAVPGCAQNCRAKTLALDEPGVAWRLRTDERLSLTMKSLSGESYTGLLPQDMKDFMVRKKDGLPAYQLCSLVDDLHFGVDLIVRGVDLWSSSLAQLYLATLLHEPGFAERVFYHHPLLADESGHKLSKSAGDTSLQFLRRQGMTCAQLYAELGKLSGAAAPVKCAADLQIV